MKNLDSLSGNLVPAIVDSVQKETVFVNAFGFGVEYSYNLNRFISINTGINYRKSTDYLFQSNNSSLSKTSSELNSISTISNTFQIKYTSMFFGLTVKI